MMVECLRNWFGDQISKKSIPCNGIDMALVETPPHVPPFFLRFQFTVIVENDLFDCNFFFFYILFFKLLTTRVEKYKLKMKL